MLIPAIISITFIYVLVILLNKASDKKFCPICAAVSFTWLWLLALLFLKYHSDTLIVSILMGGSVVGIMYQLRRTIWSHIFAVSGFSAVYLLFKENWLWFGMFLAIAIALGIWQRERFAMGIYTDKKLSSDVKEDLKEIEKKLEECCP